MKYFNLERLSIDLKVIVAKFNKGRLNLANKLTTYFPSHIENNLNLTYLNLSSNCLTKLSSGTVNNLNLTELKISDNQLTFLPNSIGNLYNLRKLNIAYNQLTFLPNSIGSLDNLSELCLAYNQLIYLPDSIGALSSLTYLDLSNNQLTSIPNSTSSLINLTKLILRCNQLTILPKSISNLHNLKEIYLDNNPLTDLSILKVLKKLEVVTITNVASLPRRYWTKFSDWKAEWLLDEPNAEIRRILIENVGYEKICDKLKAINLNTWREYTLLKIDGVERVYGIQQPIDLEPMILLKMTCQSTVHIHILRVPPEMVSAEAAITWVNHGIHPDEFAVQT